MEGAQRRIGQAVLAVEQPAEIQSDDRRGDHRRNSSSIRAGPEAAQLLLTSTAIAMPATTSIPIEATLKMTCSRKD